MDSGRPKNGTPSKRPIWEQDDKPKRSIPNLGHRHKEEEYVGKLFENKGTDGMSPVNSPNESILSVKASAHVRKESTFSPDGTAAAAAATATATATPRRTYTERHHFGWFAAVGVGFDLELWWTRSTSPTRLTAIVTSLLLFIAILNFGIGLVFLIQGLAGDPGSVDPYICKSPECNKAAVWLAEPMADKDNRTDPCDNFYEFMCQNYTEKQEEGNIFAGFITKPNFKVQLGIDSILGKILKTYKNDTRADQHIKFYQSCLNFLERKRSDENVFREIAQRWFGTRDFQTFDKPMEEIAAELFRAVGHASFINMAFYTYPYILIVEPRPFVMSYRFDNDSRNRDFLEIVFRKLMPLFGLEKGSTEDIIEDMVNGVDTMSTVIHEIFSAVIKEIIPRNEITSSKIAAIINNNRNLDGLCPPMGITLNCSKVLDLFIGDEHEVEYITPTAHKYVLALNACLGMKGDGKAMNPLSKYTFKNVNASYVALWIMDVFIQDMVASMDYKNIPGDWGFNSSTWLNHTFGSLLNTLKNYNVEYICLDTLWNSLGYLPSIRFLEADKPDSVHFIDTSEDWARELFDTATELFLSIHPEDIHWKEAFLAKAVLGRDLHADVGLPLVGGVIDAYKEDLALGKDFLNNTLVGYRFTVAKAKQNWIASTDPHPTIKWFGSGGPGNIKESLFSPHFARVDSARLVETPGAAKDGRWEKFLGRAPNNYILYPLTIFDDQRINTLSFKHALITLPLMRSILSLLSEAYSVEKYPSLTWDDLLGPKPDDIKEYPNVNCSYLSTVEHSTNSSRHEYRMVPSDKIRFTWEDDALFLSVMTAKLAFKSFLDEKERLWNGPYSFSSDETTRKLVLQRFLPKGLEEFSPQQLFFMLYIRHSCRESWKKEQPSEKNTQLHYSLEATVLSVLMQMTEFSHVWGCKGDSKMNNYGQPRCFDWEPK